MDPKVQLTEAIKAIQDLKGCFPDDSKQAESLDSLSLAVVDVVIGGSRPEKSQKLTDQLHNFIGDDAAKRLKNAHARREIDDTLVELLENNALLKTFLQQARR